MENLNHTHKHTHTPGPTVLLNDPAPRGQIETIYVFSLPLAHFFLSLTQMHRQSYTAMRKVDAGV